MRKNSSFRRGEGEMSAKKSFQRQGREDGLTGGRGTPNTLDVAVGNLIVLVWK